MFGTIVNTVAVIAGGSLGILLKKGMPERVRVIYFQAVGLFTLAIGISMVWNMKHILTVVTSIVIGALIGEWMNLEKGAEQLSDWTKKKLRIGSERFSEGLTTSFLLFCIGAMTLVGAIEEGTTGESRLLLTKSVMDGFSSILLASAFGVGVVFSAIPLFLFQGGITLIAKIFGEFLSTETIQALTAVGGVLLLGLGINILEIKRLRILNMIPALVVVVLLMWITAKFGIRLM
ncbi:MAG: DUF554 domain-containing protein [Porphyromonadaceae bacterium]|nr:DUF554 domain-containing protein [Porphyromonadaceae bacterium]